MDATTGRRLDTLDHIRQSVHRILTTPIGSRVERREFGSWIPELIDDPGNDVTRLRLQAAAVSAIARWEPRIAIVGVAIDIGLDGRGTVSLDAVVRRDGEPIRIGVPLQ